MMLCRVQIPIVSRKRGLLQNFLNCSTLPFAFWLNVATDRALQVIDYFLQFYCSTITGNVSRLRSPTCHVNVKEVNECVSAIWITRWCCLEAN